MRLLFLSNFYPPASRGGYEQWCQEAALGLRSRAHDVLVLTSAHGNANHRSSDPSWVKRELHLEMEIASLRNAVRFFTARRQREEENLTLLQRTIETHQPDAILLWGMWNLPRSLPALAERLRPGKVVYYVGDYWITLPGQFENYWNAPPRNFLTGLPKGLLKPVAKRILAREERPTLQLEHALFPSEFMRDELKRRGVSPKNAHVVYGAIDTAPYLDRRDRTRPNDGTSLLYVGRLTREKGVHTGIEAAANLIYKHGLKNLKLTIVGDGDPDYAAHLRQLVDRMNLASYVTFIPAQPKEALPSLYHQSDILLFTSIWAEPFGRVIVEAMASGLAVVGTKVGGASEILVDGENALTFTPDDPESLSLQLKRLIESPALRERLAASGRETAVNLFDVRRMTGGIESYLQNVVR
ncbi:glycosyltransferase family 4 protein [Chloroflexi bacterium CFX6]|nr:glycosyltransferase family 4 protein [Chloroflexi bacterium CFX6]